LRHAQKALNTILDAHFQHLKGPIETVVEATPDPAEVSSFNTSKVRLRQAGVAVLF